jgi:hypothetical protein
MGSLDIIMVIVIIAIVCFGSIFAHCAWINETDVDISCKLWAEQWDDLDKKLKYSKLGLAYQPKEITCEDIRRTAIDDYTKQLNEEKARVLDSMMCSSQQFEVALEQMRDCINKPEVLTFEATMSPNDMRKILGLDEIEEHEATIKDFTIKKAESVVDNPLHDDVEPKPKKLEPLICKMCGGTVAKKGDIYECEYCGLHYELR